MQNIIFLNEETPSKAEVKRLSPHTMQIIGHEKNTSGFSLVTDTGEAYGKFPDYTTIYREIHDGFILSDDGSVYVKPEPMPKPEPYEPTLEEIQEVKVAEMNAAQQEVIASGIDVTLADGTNEHFTLTQYDQQSLMGLQSQVISGVKQIPWHNSNEAEHCKFYTNADMALIVDAAMTFVTYHVTYFRDLRIYIRNMQTKEEVNEVVYGMPIPPEYQSEVIQVMEASV